MKAIIYDKSNAPDKLVMRELERPFCREGEVLVRIMSASINAADYRSMQIGAIPKRKIFGSDVAGAVDACGNNTHRFKVGDRVFGDLSACGCGGFAEYVAACEDALALIPVRVSYQDAAALPMAAVTALQALRDLGHTQPGQNVLVYGAGGGVGLFAVQLGHYFGAEVTAVCSSGNCSMMSSLGADRVVDYLEEDVTRNSHKYDLILAVNGNRPLFSFKRILAPDGIFVFVGGAYIQVIQAFLFSGLLSMGRKKFKFLAARPNSDDLETVVKLVEQGKIKPVIDRYYTLDETAEAIRYIRRGHAAGKVIINVSQT